MRNVRDAAYAICDQIYMIYLESLKNEWEKGDFLQIRHNLPAIKWFCDNDGIYWSRLLGI